MNIIVDSVPKIVQKTDRIETVRKGPEYILTWGRNIIDPQETFGILPIGASLNNTRINFENNTEDDESPEYTWNNLSPFVKEQFNLYLGVDINKIYTYKELVESDLVSKLNEYSTSVLKMENQLLSTTYSKKPTSVIIKYDTVPEQKLTQIKSSVDLEEPLLPGIYSGDVKDDYEMKTFATAAAVGLAAVGPQETILYDKKTSWIPKLHQTTNFAISQKNVKLYALNFLNDVVNITINPRECGDLIGNMYLACSLPPNINLIDRVGLSLIKKAELYLDSQLIDTYDDIWAILYDQLFLTADQQIGMDNIVNGTDLMIPLLFFFKDKSKFLPTCTLINQNIYIRLYFQPQSWFTDYPFKFDLTNVSLYYDQIFLTNEERMKMKLSSHKIIIPKILAETPVKLQNNPTMEVLMTANFNVSMIVWFIQRVSQNYKTRYTFGYTSPLVKSYTTYTDWRGNTQYYTSALSSASIFINNQNIISNFTGDVYYNFKQPIDHGLSAPTKQVYLYCFKENPTKDESSGDVDFRAISSKTTKLQLKFLDTVTSQIQGYNLCLYYYGYTTAVFENGSGRVLDL